MKLFPISCNNCHKIIYRKKGRINESKKYGWKAYCSLKCQSKTKNKQKLLKCFNLKCTKIFKRQLNDINDYKKVYCSRSCAISVNNSKFPKKIAEVRTCLFCNRHFTSKEKYCSTECMYQNKVVTKEEIIKQIKEFYLKTGRIPLKREFYHAKSAYLRFNSWNNAIKTAGFNPNPILFSKKHLAKDGHKCDSLTERIIDDWLYKKRINHKRNVPYPSDKGFTADFVIRSYWIEFFGLYGENKRYDQLRKEKIQIAKKHNLKLVEIYPKDLFPKNNLAQLLSF